MIPVLVIGSWVALAGLVAYGLYDASGSDDRFNREEAEVIEREQRDRERSERLAARAIARQLEDSRLDRHAFRAHKATAGVCSRRPQ